MLLILSSTKFFNVWNIISTEGGGRGEGERGDREGGESGEGEMGN